MKKDGKVQVIYFTDPLCCWSWALEPQWRKLRYHFREFLTLRYCMSGLIPSWDNFIDETNMISRPSQLGPLWLHAEQMSGMQTSHRLWIEDPPYSSFPACIAAKAAFLQSDEIGELYLRKVRESCMLKSNNVSKPLILIRIAEELASGHSGFSLEQFLFDYHGESAEIAFRTDWHEAQSCNVRRCPSLMMKNDDQETILISGYHSYATLKTGLLYLAPHLNKVRLTGSLDDYRKYWGDLLSREEEEFMSATGSANEWIDENHMKV